MSVIGIDLGTSTSCVAVWQDGVVTVVPNEQGKRTTQSYVAFDDRERHLGILAKNQLTRKPTNTVFATKRLIGRRFNDPEVQDDVKLWPFTVVDVGGKPKVSVQFKKNERCFTAEEISAMMLQKMKQIAETLVGDVKEAVIAVPASFNDSQRQAIIDAGTIAGLDVVRIINEPTAAALAFGLGKQLQGKHNLLIFDLGGGHLDVSIITIEDGSKYTVQATAGDSHLGGEDFDNVLLRHLAHEFIFKDSKDIFSNPRAMQKLRVAVEAAKRTLSSLPTASIEIDDLLDGVDFHTTVSREVFETLCADMFASTMEYVKKVLRDAKMDKKSVDRVVLVGGSTRIPKIQSLLQEMFGGKEFDLTINRDEAVAVGAAIQAAVLSGAAPSLHISDVTSAYTIAGIAGDVIERNTVYPCSKRVILPINDKQDVIKIEVYERGNDLVNSETCVGRCDLEISSLSSGNRLIKLDLEVNQNGILQVAPLYCGDDDIRYKYVVTECLLKAEVDELRAEAERQLEDERCEHARVNARHELEKHAYSALTFLNNIDTKQRDEAWTDLNLKAKGTLWWIKQNQEECIEEFTSRLQQITQLHQSLVRRVRGNDGDNILETQRTEHLKRLATRIVEVKRDIHNIEEKLRDSDWTEFVKLCDNTELWIKDNQNANQEEIETQLAVLESALDATKESLQKYETQLQEEQRKEEEERIRAQEQHREEEERIRAQEQRREEKERIRARDQLETFISEVQKAVSQVEGHVSQTTWKLVVQRCKETEEWIEKNRESSKAVFEEKLANLRQEYGTMKGRIKGQKLQMDKKQQEKKLKEDMEKQRVEARNQLETYIDQVKSDMLQESNLQPGYSYWDHFVRACVEELIWHQNNQMKSKEQYEEQLLILEQLYNFTMTKLKERQLHIHRTEEEEKLKMKELEELDAARNQLKKYILGVQVVMNKVEEQFRTSDWNEYVKLLADTLKWLEINQGASKNEYVEHHNIIKRQNSTTTSSIQKNKNQLSKINEQERIAVCSKLQEYVEEVRAAHKQWSGTFRYPVWKKFNKLCAETLEWIINNQEADKCVFEEKLKQMEVEYVKVGIKLRNIQETHIKLEKEQAAKLLEESELRRVATRCKLAKYVKDVRAAMFQPLYSQLDTLDRANFVSYCDETLTWIRDHQNGIKEAFDHKQSVIKGKYESTVEKLNQLAKVDENDAAKRCISEELEQQRKAAKDRLLNYVVEVKSEINQVSFQHRNLDCEEFVSLCDKTLQWIRNNQEESKEAFEKTYEHVAKQYNVTTYSLRFHQEHIKRVQEEEEKKRAEEEKKRVEEERKRGEEEKKRGEEEKKLAEEGTKREEKKRAEEERKRGEEEKKRAEEERKRAQEVEQGRDAARNRLQSFVLDVRSDMFKPDYSQFHSAEKQEFITQCGTTLNWLRTNQRESKESFEHQLAVLKSKYDSTLAALLLQEAQVQKDIANKVKFEEVEKGRTTARHGLEKHVVEMKSQMSQVLPKHRNVDWQNFDKLCDETLNWIRNNQDTSKEDFEVKHENMNHQYEVTIESLRNQEKEETRMEQLEQQRLEAEKQLRQSVITIKTEMDQIQDQHRNPDWEDCVNLCNNIHNWLSKNPEASKDACEELYQLLQRQYHDTTERLNQYQDLLHKKEEEMKLRQMREMEQQRITARRQLEEYVALVKTDMNQPAYDQLRNIERYECVKLCHKICEWLFNNPGESKDMCERQLNDLQRQHEQAISSLREYQRMKEAEDKRRAPDWDEQKFEARHRLATFVNRVKSSLHQPVFEQVRNDDWKKMIRFCDETLKWLNNNQQARRRVLEDQCDAIERKYDEIVAKLLDPKQSKIGEEQRIAARATLENYVVAAKASMEYTVTKDRDADWYAFVGSCDDMMRWIGENPDASKEEFEGQLEKMERHS